MQLPKEFTDKLGPLVQTLPVDDMTRQTWLQELGQGDVSKATLFDIIIALRQSFEDEQISGILESESLDPQVADFIATSKKQLAAGSEQIKADLENVSQDMDKLNAKLDAIEPEQQSPTTNPADDN